MAFSTPELKDIMAKQGKVIHLNNPDAAAQYFRSQMTRYAAQAKNTGAALD